MLALAQRQSGHFTNCFVSFSKQIQDSLGPHSFALTELAKVLTILPCRPQQVHRSSASQNLPRDCIVLTRVHPRQCLASARPLFWSPRLGVTICRNVSQFLPLVRSPSCSRSVSSLKRYALQASRPQTPSHQAGRSQASSLPHSSLGFHIRYLLLLLLVFCIFCY